MLFDYDDSDSAFHPGEDNLPLGMRRDKPARCEGVKVSDSEGLANHTGPESCVVVGNGCGEALTGERAGRVLSSEIKVLSRCRRAPNTRKAIRHTPTRRGVGRLGGVEDPWHARKPLARDPGGATLGLGEPKVRTENPRGYGRDARGWRVGQSHST